MDLPTRTGVCEVVVRHTRRMPIWWLGKSPRTRTMSPKHRADILHNTSGIFDAIHCPISSSATSWFGAIGVIKDCIESTSIKFDVRHNYVNSYDNDDDFSLTGDFRYNICTLVRITQDKFYIQQRWTMLHWKRMKNVSNHHAAPKVRYNDSQ